MISRKFTKLFWIVGIALICSIDLILNFIGITLSDQAAVWAPFAALPFLFGVLPFHFWGGTRRDYFGKMRLPLLLGIGVVVIAFSAFSVKYKWVWVGEHWFVFFAGGCATGRYLWSQKMDEGESDAESIADTEGNPSE